MKFELNTRITALLKELDLRTDVIDELVGSQIDKRFTKIRDELKLA